MSRYVTFLVLSKAWKFNISLNSNNSRLKAHKSYGSCLIEGMEVQVMLIIAAKSDYIATSLNSNNSRLKAHKSNVDTRYYFTCDNAHV
jgi:hypothetical protein